MSTQGMIRKREKGALCERHKSKTGLSEGMKVSHVAELAAGTAWSVFLSALWHQCLLRC